MKTLVISIILFCVCILSIKSIGIFDSLRREISSLEVQNPSDWNNYLSNVYSEGDLKFESFFLAGSENRINSLDFDETVKAKIRMIVYAKSISFQSFYFMISSEIGRLYQIIGTVIKSSNNRIKIMYMKMNTFAGIKQQYDVVSIRRCKRIFFFIKKCKNFENHVPRGLHAGEINLIEQAMKYNSYMYIKNKVSGLSTLENSSPNFDMFEKTEQLKVDNKYKFIDNFENFNSQLKGALEAVKEDENISAIFSNDLFVDKIQAGVIIKKLKNLNKSKINDLLKSFDFIRFFNEENIYHIQIIFDQLFAMISEKNHNQILRIISSQNILVLYEFFIHHGDNENEFDVEIRIIDTMKAIDEIIPFKLMKTNDENQYTSFDSRCPYNGEIDALSTILELISQVRSFQPKSVIIEEEQIPNKLLFLS